MTPQKYTIGDAPAQSQYTIGDAPAAPETPAPSLLDRYNAAVAPLVTPHPHNLKSLLPGKNGQYNAGDYANELLAKPLENIGAGVFNTVLHPIDTATGIVKTAVRQLPPVALAEHLYRGTDVNQEMADQFIAHPLETLETMIGQGLPIAALGEVPGMARSVRNAAIGDPNAAALRGLRVPPSSSKSLRTVSAVEGSRPYLQGAKNLQDVQEKLPGAKNEVWGQYQKTVDSIGDRPVQGPDGKTTIRNLEEERQQLSALNRDLKAKDPQAIQTAQQKGMTQAQLLAREKAVQQSLDPHLREAGIDPQAIRKTFSQLSTVEGRVSGRSTIAEPSQPYGFGRIKNLDLKAPLKYPGQLAAGARDIAAGRPLWSGKPTDVSLREAFRPGGEKPYLGEYRAQPRLGAGEPEPEMGRQYPFPPPVVTPPPMAHRFLPAEASSGEPQPMLRYARPYVEPYDPELKPVNLAEYVRRKKE